MAATLDGQAILAIVRSADATAEASLTRTESPPFPRAAQDGSDLAVTAGELNAGAGVGRLGCSDFPGDGNTR